MTYLCNKLNILTNTHCITMKKLLLATLIVATMGLTNVSCSKKVVTASYPEYTGEGNSGGKKVSKVKEEIDECEQMAFDAPDTEFRGYASAIDEDRDFARQQAIMLARADIASQIENLTLSVIKGYRATVKANGVRSSESDIKQDVGSMAEETLKSSRVIGSNRYRLSDGTYEVSVCVSVPANTIEKIVGATTLSDDERLKVEFNEKQFRESYADELKAFRDARKKH